MENVSQLVVLIDDQGNECLYINGVSWKALGESTVYAVDIAEASGGHPFVLQHTAVERPAHAAYRAYPADWPKLLKDAAGWIISDEPAEPQTNREPIIPEVLDAFACRESQVPPSIIDVLSVEPLKGGDLETELALNALLVSPSKIGVSTATGQ